MTKVEWTNPHIWFFIDVKSEDGTVTNWGFEMAGPAQLVRAGWRRDSMKVGDVVMVEASRARDGRNIANALTIVTSTGQRLFARTHSRPPAARVSNHEGHDDHEDQILANQRSRHGSS